MTRRLLAAALVTLASAMLAACSPDPPSFTIPISAEHPADATPAPVPAATATNPPDPTPTSQPSSTAADYPTPPTRKPATPLPTVGLLRLADNLDDPQGYCVDVAGFRANIRLNAPLQAHTCKPDSDDQLFAMIDPAGGGIRLAGYDRCVAAAMMAPGSEVNVAECDIDAANQRFALDDDGLVYLSSTDGPALCLSVAPGAGQPAGGRNHLRRDLLLQACDAVEPALMAWELAENQRNR